VNPISIPALSNAALSKMKRISTKKLFVFIAATNCVSSALDPLPAQTTTTSVPTTETQQQASLSWLHDAGKAYVLHAVQPPPSSGSDRDKADLQAVLNAQTSRTAGESQEALTDQKFSPRLLSKAVGPNFTPENYPITFNFLSRVLADTTFLNSVLQAKYKRGRPYQDHPEVKNLFTLESSSYPSEQAASSRMLMLVLSELFPERVTALLDRDEAIAQSGVNAGVYYPSDVIAGRALAQALMFVLQDNPGFDGDMAKVRSEIAAQKK
jgi:acid phosphatase (class A)